MARKGHPLADIKSLADLVDAVWVIAGLRDRVKEEFEEVFSAWGAAQPGCANTGRVQAGASGAACHYARAGVCTPRLG